LEEQIKRVKTELGNINASVDCADDLLAGAVEENSKNVKALQDIATTIGSLTKEMITLKNLYAEYTAAVAAFKALPASVDNSTALTELDALLAKQASFVTYQNNLKARDTLEQTLLAETCRESVYKAVVKIVNDEQGKVMEYAFNEVLAVSRHFTDGLLNSPLEFH